MSDLFSQPDLPKAPVVVNMEHVPDLIRQHYPNAWRCEDVPTAPAWASDKRLVVAGSVYLVWEMYYFKEFKDNRLIIYYKKRVL